MPCRGEVFADDLGEDPCCGPDADRRQRRQDRVKRVGLHEGFDLGEDGVPGLADVGEHPGQLGQHDRGRVGPSSEELFKTELVPGIRARSILTRRTTVNKEGKPDPTGVSPVISWILLLGGLGLVALGVFQLAA